ncbi:MmcQ/YjbR family DNA-binding protein [Mollicutes bacterium LVI A0039]|nr:MmcQ/YjbR family DNA-binding protein [Mollicutes bacterium LVI A0039]
MNLDNAVVDLLNVEVAYPFDEKTRVYKVENKMFMLTDNQYTYANLKNDPDKNYLLRTSFDYITPGYHMNKEHWNTIDLQAEFDENLVKGLIIESYVCIIKKLPKKTQVKYASILAEYQN